LKDLGRTFEMGTKYFGKGVGDVKGLHKRPSVSHF